MISGKQKKKDTVRISKKDLLRLLHENEELHNLVADLREELLALKVENNQIKNDPYPFPVYIPAPGERHPDLGPEPPSFTTDPEVVPLDNQDGPDMEVAPDDWGPGPGRSPNTPLPDDYRGFGPRTDIFFDGRS